VVEKRTFSTNTIIIIIINVKNKWGSEISGSHSGECEDGLWVAPWSVVVTVKV
jgi:hypothetical protein